MLFYYTGPEDIYDGNLKLIMGFIWTLIGHFQIRSTGRGLSTKQAMKEWLNTLIPEYGVQNFTTDWNDGRALCGLVDCLKPGLCPNHLSMDPKQALENCRLGMELAQKHFGIPVILKPEDLRNPDVDKLSVMTYLSYFFEPALKQLLEWIQHKIPQQKITNLSTDWNSGINLGALMAACHTGLMPNWKELDPHKSLANMKECVEVAKRLLNIECPVAPSVLTDPKVDEIVMATYLSRFKYSKLIAQADKLSIIAPRLPHDVAVVGMPIEFGFDLGQDPSSVINDLEITATGPTKSDEVNLTTGDKTSGSFVPSEAGDYEVDCKLNGDSIKGCPFKIIVIDPKEWMIAANVPQFLHVGKLLRLPVEGPDDRIKVTCTACDTEGHPVNFIDSSIDTSGPKNRCNVIFDPNAVGNAVVSIKVAGIDVQKSPFPVKVCDVSHCTVSGLVGTGKTRVGDPIEFHISTVGAGDDKPKLSGKGPTSGYHPHVVEEGEGEYEATFTPLEPGDHNIDITFGGEKIPGSPFHKYVEALPDSGSCSATGPGLTQAIALEPATFSVITPEKGLLNKPDTLIVKVTSETNEEAEVKIEEEQNGAYLVTYVAPTEGNYKINMQFYGNEIPGCPFETKVLPPSDASKCRAYGPALHPNALLIQRRPIDFFVDAKNAGTGKLQVEARGPDKKESKIFIAEDEGVYSLKCDPLLAGWYLIKVWWSKKQIPGSPFKLKVHPGADASKVKAHGPGLGPTIEVGKTSRFIIETKNAGIGTLSVVVHGIKDAFKVEVNPVDDSDSRTLNAEYNPTQGGEYSVTIKWSGKEIPGSPFPVKVVDYEYELQLAAEKERIQVEREELAKRKAQNELFKKQREAWIQAQAKVQAAAAEQYGAHVKKAASSSGLLQTPTGGMVTSKHVQRTHKKVHRSAKSASAVVVQKRGMHPRQTSAPNHLQLMPNNSLTVGAAMHSNAQAMIPQQMQEAYGLSPISSPPDSPEAVIVPYNLSGPQSRGGGDELPLPYTPIYVATGEMPSKQDLKKQAKAKAKAKKKKQWRY